jgi:hypothetical protein
MQIRRVVIPPASCIAGQERTVCFSYWLIAMLSVLFLAGCGGSSNSPNPAPTPTVQIAISPATATLFTNQSKTFTASVSGSSDAAMTWSVQEGASGGTVTSSGLYTAPSSAGTYHVIVTSHADSTRTATSTITVPGAAPAPTFTSTAPTGASEGQGYSYSLTATDPAGGTVSFQLTSGPTNASITGSVLTWTPSHAQSRLPNNFTITATTSEQGSATQTFAVNPNGNINGVLNTISYSSNGKIVGPSQATGVVAFIPNGNGSYTQVTGTGNLGSFTIPNIPPGYFMLGIGVNSYYSELLWTNASDVDFSNPVQGRPNPSYATTTPNLNVNFTIASQSGGLHDCYSFVPNLGSWVFIHDSDFYKCAGQWVNSFSWYYPLPDPTQGDQTYVYQTQPVANLLNNTWTGHQLADFAGPLSLAIPNGGNVNFSGSMNAQSSNATVRANLSVSQFAALTAGVSPSFSGISVFTMNVQPFTSEYYLTLGAVNSNTDNSTMAPLVLYPYAQTNTDADLGDVPYANPFPATWPTYAAFNIIGQLSYNADGATSPAQFWGGIGTLSLNLPTAGSPIAPLVGPATSIKINGNDFFQPQPNVGSQPVVSWSAPTVGTPDGYSLNVIQLKTVAGGITIQGNVSTIYTTQTSVTVPSGILQSGYAYVFQLQAFKGNSNVETAPNYATFPWGYADAFSGVVHVP